MWSADSRNHYAEDDPYLPAAAAVSMLSAVPVPQRGPPALLK
jgi:hypothetical protein